MSEAGLDIREDPMGNIWGHWEGSEKGAGALASLLLHVLHSFADIKQTLLWAECDVKYSSLQRTGPACHILSIATQDCQLPVSPVLFACDCMLLYNIEQSKLLAK